MCQPRSGLTVILAGLISPAWAGLVQSGSDAGDADPPPAATTQLVPVDYVLDVRVDYDASKLCGHCRLTIRNAGAAAVERVPLYLYRLLEVRGVAEAGGAVLPFTQRVAALPDWPTRQVNRVDVRLSTPLAPGGQVVLAIQYDGYLLGYAELGMQYIRDRIDQDFVLIREDCDAYPQVGGDSWKSMRARGLPEFTYTAHVAVPKAYVVANGGELLGKQDRDGNVTYSYQSIKPSFRIDLAIGDYVILRDGTNKVFCFRQDEAGGKRVLSALKDALALYAKWFGPLVDFRGYAVIEIPEGWGSQADVTSIIQDAAAFQRPDALGRLYHEVAHQWNVRAREAAPCRVESEGFATLMQFLAEEKLEGRGGAVADGVKRLASRFKEACERNPRLAQIAIIDYGRERVTDLAYSKGMVFFAVLYELAGAEVFNEIIAMHYRQYHATGASADDFFKTCKRLGGAKVARLIDEWVYGTQSSAYLLQGLALDELVSKYR